MARLLLVDADERCRRALTLDLEQEGHVVHGCSTPAGIERLLRSETWDAVLCDQDTASLDSFRAALEGPDPPAVLLLAGFGSIHQAVEAMRSGAADYLSKPVSLEQLQVSLGRALERRELRAENERLKATLGERSKLGSILSRAPAMLRIFDTVKAVADTRATILIEGESGTGKTMLARAIHRHSSRSEGPFVEVNCGALPGGLLESELFGHVRGAFTGAVKDRAGKFEAAGGGSIFLDEIATASADLQVKLLRVIQDRVFERVGDGKTRKTDVRVIAATNCDLEAAVQGGSFRKDLYYRLHVVAMRVPALRERPGDVQLLSDYFLNRYVEEYDRPARGFTPAARAAIASHGWPGNVRELENCIERAVLLAPSELVDVRDLPDDVASEAARAPASLPVDAVPGLLPLRAVLEATERRLIMETLRVQRGSRKETARSLGVNRTTLFNKMKKYDLMHLSSWDTEVEGSSESPTQAPADCS